MCNPSKSKCYSIKSIKAYKTRDSAIQNQPNCNKIIAQRFFFLILERVTRTADSDTPSISAMS